jgi:hypothetical protein
MLLEKTCGEGDAMYENCEVPIVLRVAALALSEWRHSVLH